MSLQDITNHENINHNSTTLEELRQVPRDKAIQTLQRLKNGHRDKSGASYPAATTNINNCILVQKTPNRKENGYIQIAPIVQIRTRAKLRAQKKTKPKPQNAHRLVVIAHKSQDDIDHLFNGQHASHLCNNPTCINHEHIVVEPKCNNEARKQSAKLGPIIHTKINGQLYTLPPLSKCTCQPSCIFRVGETSTPHLIGTHHLNKDSLKLGLSDLLPKTLLRGD